MNHFEEVIKKDDALSRLLNDKDVTVFSNFSRTNYSDELKDYIQEKYYSTFIDLYRKGVEQNNVGQVNALIRSLEFLATEETKIAVTTEFVETLKIAYDTLLAFKNSLEENGEEIQLAEDVYEPIDGLTINILNTFGAHERINEYKCEIISVALDVCDLVSNVKPKKSPFKYAVYNIMINSLMHIENFGPSQSRFEIHQRKISKKRAGVEVKYVVLGALIVLLLLLKLATKLG